MLLQGYAGLCEEPQCFEFSYEVSSLAYLASVIFKFWKGVQIVFVDLFHSHCVTSVTSNFLTGACGGMPHP